MTKMEIRFSPSEARSSIDCIELSVVNWARWRMLVSLRPLGVILHR